MGVVVVSAGELNEVVGAGGALSMLDRKLLKYASQRLTPLEISDRLDGIISAPQAAQRVREILRSWDWLEITNQKALVMMDLIELKEILLNRVRGEGGIVEDGDGGRVYSYGDPRWAAALTKVLTQMDKMIATTQTDLDAERGGIRKAHARVFIRATEMAFDHLARQLREEFPQVPESRMRHALEDAVPLAIAAIDSAVAMDDRDEESRGSDVGVLMRAGEYLGTLEGQIMAELRQKSRKLIYQQDPMAWLWDILGVRLWSLQAEIMQSFADNTFTLVKSCNGVGKTQVAGFAVAWFANVFETTGTSIMVSAPVRAQIDEMMFRYLRQAYQMSVQRGRQLVGEIMPRQPKWIYTGDYKHDLVVPKRPADSNLLSSFQGVHNDHVAVVLDEAGGLAEDFFIGANAVTTNEHARILAIGNPDRLNTAFHRRFTDRTRFRDWHTFTIGAEDTPNFTGEVIYPENPELDRQIKARLVQVEWAAMMRRSALPGVIAAKVDGEFPDADDSTFFDEETKKRAWETEIEPGFTDHAWLGVDLSYQGEDKCVAYLNHGGQIRKVDEWNRYTGTEHMESAKRIHELAKKHDATEVRVDSAGTGSGVYSNLKTEEQFADRRYVLVGILGANSSPNVNVWKNARAWHYDSFRKGMREGRVDLDMLDTGLREDMDVQSWFPTGRGQIQITSKTELKKQGLHSPDHLDAAIYSFIPLNEVTEGPGAGLEPGDEMWSDPWAYADELEMAGVGMPL